MYLLYVQNHKDLAQKGSQIFMILASLVEAKIIKLYDLGPDIDHQWKVTVSPSMPP